jgi:Eco57I restriction-modification methylase
MDKDTRNAIERATQRARKLLEEDFAAQLEGDFDVHRDGAVAAKAGGHLSARQAFQRERIVAAIEHKRAAGMNAADSVADYLRDAAFTTLNRFVALKMLEARELVQECITKGEQSAGYREFCGMAPGLPLLPDSAGYRLYIESLFDELSTEVKVLFDRRDPSSVVWPKRATFEQLLEILNTTELAGVWGEDETIGWVYQFFNGKEERQQMRKESPVPRNSRELAVRNQFFTPRYVVQFLTDNTLGRIWYEMHATNTALADKCEYMVRKPGEEFARRAKKDPRDLRVLDPACGSGHFLLYAFDLLIVMYEEAFNDPDSPKSESTGRKLSEDYPCLDGFRKAIPGMVLAQNLHGVDIDPRCAQIAQLALWMRAQKAYRDFGIGRPERAQIRRSNIVVAEPLVADERIVKEFVAKLGDAELGRVFTSLVEALSLAGDLGLLLRIEHLVKTPAKKQGDLFAPPEERIRAALDRFVREEAGTTNTRRRLFAGDAVQGVALLGIAEKRFDVVLMNPPFGQPVEGVFDKLSKDYAGAHHDIYATFVSRAAELAPQGAVGCISSRSFLVTTRLEGFRRELVLPCLALLADLGPNVMDNASVESAAYVLKMPSAGMEAFTVLSRDELPQRALHTALGRSLQRSVFHGLPAAKILHGLSSDFLELLSGGAPFEGAVGTAREGMKSFDNFRFVRLWWEVHPNLIGAGTEFDWTWFAKGGGHVEWFMPADLVINWSANGRELQDINLQLNGSTAQVRQASTYWFRRGATYSRRSIRFAVRVLPDEHIFSTEGPAVLLESGATSAVTNEYLLGWLNSRLCRSLVEIQANKQKYLTGILKRLPWRAPPPELAASIGKLVGDALQAQSRMHALSEVSPQFVGLPSGTEFESRRLTAQRIFGAATSRTRECENFCNDRIDRLYSVDSSKVVELVADASDVDEEPDDGEDLSDSTDSFAAAYNPDALTSWLVGVAFGRFDPRLATGERAIPPEPEPFDPPPSRSPGMYPEGEEPAARPDILVDDEGHPDDLAGRAQAVAERVEVEALENLRGSLAKEFFSLHIKMYSKSRRKAPIYWQLATTSASYSVWLYIHAFSKDTLFRLQNDYAAPKLVHEERRLESLTSELRDGATAAQRKQLAAQESFVEELRTFLEEVKRVAPLWNPNLDDGVIINFAPLWRLVPQNKSWQKELKSTWDALRDGKYDWAHLAMHFWPERVVPKCTKDRSLAIAHGLEDVFWVEDAAGKWSPKPDARDLIPGLTRERTFPAVKSALESLLEAPSAAGNSGRGRLRRRRAAAKGVNGAEDV